MSVGPVDGSHNVRTLGTRRILGLAVLALTATTASAAANDCTLLVPQGFAVDEYAAAVKEYRHGRFTAAGQRLRALAPDRVDEVFDFFEENGWSEPCLLAASLLHTEIGMQGQKDFMRPGDPQHHFESARKLTDFVRSQSRTERFNRDWLLLMGLFYQKLMFDPEGFERNRTEVLSLASVVFLSATRYFDKAVASFPDDAEILLAAGTLFEWSGAPRFGEPRYLAKAEKLYERASRADPNDAVAQLRYGNTLSKRGRSERAVVPLRRVLELSNDDELVFRARIALGRIAMLDGNHQDAVSHFRAAREVKPKWQVGSLALSHALHMSGARDESRRVLEHGLSVQRSQEDVFAWWSYETGLIDRFGPLLESMRDEVLF